MHFSRQRDILLTLHERSTRLTLARRLHSKNAVDTADAIIAELSGCQARPAKRSRTPLIDCCAINCRAADNGGEFARHHKVKDALGMPAYFCDPYSPLSADC